MHPSIKNKGIRNSLHLIAITIRCCRCRIGFLQLAEHLEEHVSYTAVSVACFAASLLLPYAAAAGLLSSSLASTLAAVSMTVTFVLSGIPQLAETAEAFASGRVDTHVLMSFSVLGTLYLHMPHEVGDTYSSLQHVLHNQPAVGCINLQQGRALLRHALLTCVMYEGQYHVAKHPTA